MPLRRRLLTIIKSNYKNILVFQPKHRELTVCATVGADALEDGTAVVQGIDEHMNLGLIPRNQPAVKPDEFACLHISSVKSDGRPMPAAWAQSTVTEYHGILFAVNPGSAAFHQFAEKNFLGERVADFFHDQATERPGPIGRFIADRRAHV